jgi:hypothetical protein
MDKNSNITIIRKIESDCSFNFVELVNTKPITRLSKENNSKLLSKIKDTFTETQQNLFISSFYCYLNYNQTTDFVIDFDDIWKWLGFTVKQSAKTLLTKYFIIDKDYKILLKQTLEQTTETRGGHNREIIMLNIRTFKLFCIKTGTEKANEIHEYFVKLEDLLHDIILEESAEIRLQLQNEKAQNDQKQAIINKQKEELELMQVSSKVPTIYIFNTDVNVTETPLLKIGITNNLHDRVKPYKSISPYGKVVFYQKIEETHINIKDLEHIIHYHLSKFKVKNELFRIDVEEAISCIQSVYSCSKVFSNENAIERKEQSKKLQNVNLELNQPKEIQQQIRNILKCDASTQTDFNELEPITVPIIQGNPEFISKFEKFVNEHCTVHQEADVSAKDIIGQYRILCKEAKRETTQALTDYLKRRFVYSRIKSQDKDQIIYGFKGIKLNDIEYKRNLIPNEAETFVFEKCIFTPGGTVLVKDIIEEYHNWRHSLKKSKPTEEEELLIKKYLKQSPYTLFETVWTTNGNGQGFYGIMLKKEQHFHRKSSTGCEVTKINENGQVLCKYNTIAKAAETEKMCTAKMSRAIKNKTMFGTSPNQYYYSK